MAKLKMSDPLRLRPIGEHAALVRDRLTTLTGAELVEDPDRTELVVMTPEDLVDLFEDAHRPLATGNVDSAEATIVEQVVAIASARQ